MGVFRRGSLVLLCVAGAALASSVQLDPTGNVLRVEQTAPTKTVGDEIAVELRLAWGNLNNRPGIGYYTFDGFAVPEKGSLELVEVEGFTGERDRVLNAGPRYVSWESGGLNEVEGVRLTVQTSPGGAVRLKVGDWQGVLEIDEGGLVEGSLRRTTELWTTEGPLEEIEMGKNRANAWVPDDTPDTIRIRWGNLDSLPRVPYAEFDGYAQIIGGQGRLEIVHYHSWESDGTREQGKADRIVEETDQLIRWEASTVGDGDGLNIKVHHERGVVTVLVVVADFQRRLTFRGTGDYNRSSVWLDDDGQTIKLRWGNLDDFPTTPFAEYDGWVEIIEGSGVLQVTYLFNWERGGDYAEGTDDRVLEGGPDRVAWQASVKGGSGGLDIRVTPSSEVVRVRIMLGERETLFTVKSESAPQE